ncbi:hypothetical protein Goshw_016925 [Gossypium schwendimanii]|uniref:Reverse transcriptase domain-containing protein n=1 Tax=Gossypium schwendimanii TaxID=34291 RepID=A0A7J9MY25_GOSSC|nr:hypothetical protein [Gossypium schwendimanii]
MCPLFGESIDSFELLDFGFRGLQFTWKRDEVFERFLMGWVKHPGFSNFVKENWNISDSMLTTHSNFTNKVRHWNKDVYGHITSRKNHLVRKLNNIQSVLDSTNSAYLHQLKMEVREELDNILHHEKLLWHQKNKIAALKNDSGECILDDEKLKIEAINFYANLYGEHLGPMHILPSNAFPYLNDLNTSFLNKSLSNEEIKSILFYMAPLKALGNDEYHTLFYQSQWNHVGVSVIHSMRSKYKKGRWIAIKIDLEKAYRVLWNRVPTQKLCQVRGVRQRCLLSLYLFILCMEWLAHSIYPAINADSWSLIRWARTIPHLSHLFFANDLILFGQAEEHQARVIKGVLYNFCESMMIPKGLCEEIEWIVKRFIWVSHNWVRKMALVGFNIMTNSNALWVRVLRLKYGVQNRLPKSLKNGRYSFLWISLTKFQELGIQKFQELQQAFGIQKNPFGSYRGSPKDLNDLIVGPDLAKNCVYLTTDGLVRNKDSFVATRGFGILDGLKLTLQRDYGSVLIQTNSLKPVNAILDVSLGF